MYEERNKTGRGRSNGNFDKKTVENMHFVEEEIGGLQKRKSDVRRYEVNHCHAVCEEP